MVQVDETEVGRHSQVGDDVHGLLGDGTGADLDTSVGSETGLLEGPSKLAIRNPADVLATNVS